MNVFNFLTALVVCMAVVAVFWLLTRYTISFRIIHKEEFDKSETPVIDTKKFEETKKPDSTTIPQVYNMDNVIGAANALMGVETVDNDEGGVNE